MTAGSPTAEPPAGPVGEAAAAVFADRLPTAVRLYELLATAGIERGLLGPREVPRLWERHLLNCAVVTDLVPAGARVVDVGSGAGLPGLVLAVRRPDLRVELVEPLQRRCDFLAEAVSALGLSDAVQVVRGRAEERQVIDRVAGCDYVTARAVAPLDRLVRWCLPLLRTGGQLLALKGRQAAVEVATQRRAIERAGGTGIRIVACPVPHLDESTSVVLVQRGASRGRKGKA